MIVLDKPNGMRPISNHSIQIQLGLDNDLVPHMQQVIE